MKTIIYLFLSFVIFYSCSSDGDNKEEEIPTSIENVVYDESLDGDLSDDNLTPTAIILASVDNRIISNQETGNADYFTFDIPSGYQLSEINLESYESDGAAFIGIGEGTSITGFTASDIIGGLIYGGINVGTNILPEMGTLDEVSGFSSPLSSGQYTIWLNQNGSDSSAILNLVLD